MAHPPKVALLKGGTSALSGQSEHRQVTVLVTDIVGFTAFVERAGEEAAFALVSHVSGLTTATVHHHRGSVTNFTGDGILALFGAPTALEDGPLRACRAALEIQERIAEAGDRIEAELGFRPALRISLTTGPVVLGAVDSGASTGVGSLWRRRQSCCPPANRSTAWRRGHERNDAPASGRRDRVHPRRGVPVQGQERSAAGPPPGLRSRSRNAVRRRGGAGADLLCRSRPRARFPGAATAAPQFPVPASWTSSEIPASASRDCFHEFRAAAPRPIRLWCCGETVRPTGRKHRSCLSSR